MRVPLGCGTEASARSRRKLDTLALASWRGPLRLAGRSDFPHQHQCRSLLPPSNAMVALTLPLYPSLFYQLVRTIITPEYSFRRHVLNPIFPIFSPCVLFATVLAWDVWITVNRLWFVASLQVTKGSNTYCHCSHAGV